VNLMLGGDILLAVDRIPIEANASNYRIVRERLRKMRPGEPLTITVLRGGQVIELKVSDFLVSGTR
jgi:S1-C subfamily serine protease